MSFENRLRRVEEHAVSEACGRCFLEPERIYAFYPDSEADEPELEVPTCSGCGRSLGVALRVVYEGEGA